MAGLSATRLTDHTLAVSGDYTAYLVAGRAVLCDCGADGEKKRIVESSSFAAGATTVTLVTDATRALTSNLDTIQWSVVSTGTDSNIPYHSHEDDDDGGLITQAITDNHIVTVDGSPSDDEYAKWTADGLEGRTGDELLGDVGLETALKQLTETEILELLNIGATTISSAQWGYLGAMSGQPLESETDTLDDVADRGATTDQALTTGGLDVGGNNVDLGAGNLIVDSGGDVTLSAGELAYLDGLDQALATTDGPTFAGLTVSDNIDLDGHQLIIDEDGDTYLYEVDDDDIAMVIGATTGEFAIDIGGVDVHIWEEEIYHCNRELRVYYGGGNYVALHSTANDLIMIEEGHIGIDNQNELRWYDDGSNYVGFEAPALTADQVWVLPDADGSADQFLQTDGSGNLDWATLDSGGFSPASVETKTADYTITTDDFDKSLRMNSSSTKTFTLPSVDSGNDGSRITLIAIGGGGVLIEASDSDTVNGGSFIAIAQNNVITLEYIHATTDWEILAITDDMVPSGTVTDFQANAATGTATYVDNLNDNNTDSQARLSTGQYGDITYDYPVLVNRYRHYGDSRNNGDGTLKIQYWNGASWVDWVTGISSRDGSWSSWDDSGGAIITEKIRWYSVSGDSYGYTSTDEIEVDYD